MSRVIIEKAGNGVIITPDCRNSTNKTMVFNSRYDCFNYLTKVFWPEEDKSDALSDERPDLSPWARGLVDHEKVSEVASYE